MDIHPYKRACWTYAHQLLGDEVGPFSELVQRIGATMWIERDCLDFGKLLVACYNAGANKAYEEYRKHLEDLGHRVQVSQQTGSPASAATEGSPEAARPARAGSGRHATTASRKGHR